MAQNATGQRANPQVHSNAPCRRAFFAIAFPSAPPTTMSRKMPAVVIPLRTTRRIAIPRTFQIGRVSCSSCALFIALITDDIAPLAAQTAPTRPMRNASRRGSSRRVPLQAADEVDHAVGRDRIEQALEVVEEVEEPERADEKGHRREEGEERAVGDLLGEARAVVLLERGEAPLERGPPVGQAQLLGRARSVPGGRVSISRGRQCGSGRALPSSRPPARAGRSVERLRRRLPPAGSPRRARRPLRPEGSSATWRRRWSPR